MVECKREYYENGNIRYETYYQDDKHHRIELLIGFVDIVIAYLIEH